MLTKKEVEDFIVKFPIYQYAFLTPEDIDFSPKVRSFCRRDCRFYDTNWACPPAVPRVEKCRLRCSQYSNVLFFSSVGSIGEGTKEARDESKQGHEDLVKIIEDHLINNGYKIYTLTSDTCTLCPKCTFPHEYCRHPELMHPCIESHGIVISDLAVKFNMDYNISSRLHLWFALVFYEEAAEAAEGKADK